METIQFFPLRNLSENKTFQKGDVFVLVGELFGRGYINGLLNEVKKNGMTIFGSTVGRRENDQLRKLTQEELQEKEQELGGKIINVPLEAGFDLELFDGEHAIADVMNQIKFDHWEDFELPQDDLEKAIQMGQERFRTNFKLFLSELTPLLPKNKNVYFAHTMAGGVPRSKIVLVVANRVYKGRGDRYISSERLWKSGIGKIMEKSFNEVTAHTYQVVLEETQAIQDEVKASGKKICFSAYGYHGCEILINNKLTWQTYTPYQQGHAKKKLEEVSIKANKKGIQSVVFNCPEIKTNSSDIFVGVELSLFPLLHCIENQLKPDLSQIILDKCAEKLSPETHLHDILADLKNYFESETLQQFYDFNHWPMENTLDLAQIMVDISEKITNLHKNRKDLITNYLSHLIVNLSGKLIFNTMDQAPNPVLWIGHDIIIKQLNALENPDFI